VVPHSGKNVDYVTVLIPKSYLVVLKEILVVQDRGCNTMSYPLK